METNTSTPLSTLPESGAMTATGNAVSPSLVNLYRITKVLERLATHFVPGNRSDAFEFFNLCLSLSRYFSLFTFIFLSFECACVLV